MTQGDDAKLAERAIEFAKLVLRNDGAADHVETAQVLSDCAAALSRHHQQPQGGGGSEKQIAAGIRAIKQQASNYGAGWIFYSPHDTEDKFARAIVQAVLASLPSPVAEDEQPRVIDNDAGEISVTLGGKELRGWSYKDDSGRKTKMIAAREYVEGWCDGRDAR